MLTFLHPDGRFQFRSVAVFIHAGHVLIQRAEGEDFWALPGGRVEFGEPAAATVVREMREELAIETQVERLLWVAENFFCYNGTECHELGMYFLMTIPDDWKYLNESAPFFGFEGNTPFICQWHPLAALDELVIYPTFLVSGLRSLPEHIVNIVHQDP